MAQDRNMPRELQDDNSESIHEADFGELIEQNAALNSTAMEEMKKQSGFLTRYFGRDELTKLTKDKRLEEARSGFEFRKQLLQVAMEFRKQQVEEKYTTLLQSFQLKYRGELYQYAMDKLKELREKMDKHETDLQEAVDKKLSEADRYRDKGRDIIANNSEKSAQKTLEEISEWLHKLVEDYKEIVNSKVSSNETNISDQ